MTACLLLTQWRRLRMSRPTCQVKVPVASAAFGLTPTLLRRCVELTVRFVHRIALELVTCSHVVSQHFRHTNKTHDHLFVSGYLFSVCCSFSVVCCASGTINTASDHHCYGFTVYGVVSLVSLWWYSVVHTCRLWRT